MVYLLKALANSPARPAPPQRRRIIVIGAGPTGLSAAFHLGEHSLILERRSALEDIHHDHPKHFPLGTARGGALGSEGGLADVQRSGASAAASKAFFISCSSTSEAAGNSNNLIHVERWQPPVFTETPAIRDEFDGSEQHDPHSLRALLPLLRGEVLFGACVVRVSPSLHMLELADGRRFVYDKLLCTLPLPDVTSLIAHELASRISHDEYLRCWLKEFDIEVADRATQFFEGDIDEVGAGKRVAALINRSLATRFQVRRGRPRGSSLFQPRLVHTARLTP